jgi:hypothetical protein
MVRDTCSEWVTLLVRLMVGEGSRAVSTVVESWLSVVFPSDPHTPPHHNTHTSTVRCSAPTPGPHRLVHVIIIIIQRRVDHQRINTSTHLPVYLFHLFPSLPMSRPLEYTLAEKQAFLAQGIDPNTVPVVCWVDGRTQRPEYECYQGWIISKGAHDYNLRYCLHRCCALHTTELPGQVNQWSRHKNPSMLTSCDACVERWKAEPPAPYCLCYTAGCCVIS